MIRTFRSLLIPILFAGSLMSASLLAQSLPKAASPLIEQRALDLLETARARLDSSKTFSFRTRTPAASPDAGGIYAAFFADSQVAVMRPDKARAKLQGAIPPLQLVFDGAKLTVYQPTLNVYSIATLETVLPFASQRPELLFLLGNVTQGDPKVVMQQLTRARYKGAATIAGNRCEHAAFAAPGVEWELWVDARSALPCRLTGALLEVESTPRFAMDFYDWKLNPALSPSSFTFARPIGATELDMRTLIGQ